MFDKWKTLIGWIQIFENINGKESDWIYMFILAIYVFSNLKS